MILGLMIIVGSGEAYANKGVILHYSSTYLIPALPHMRARLLKAH